MIQLEFGHPMNTMVCIGLVGSSSDLEDVSEPTDVETRSRIAKPLKGSPQIVLNDSGVDKGSRDVVSLVSWRQLNFVTHLRTRIRLV